MVIKLFKYYISFNFNWIIYTTSNIIKKKKKIYFNAYTLKILSILIANE